MAPRVIGSLVCGKRVRPFVLEYGQLRLDAYEPDAVESQPEKAAAERDVRRAAPFAVDEVRIGEYLCGQCDHWVSAHKQAWSVGICLSCSLDRGTELSESQ